MLGKLQSVLGGGGGGEGEREARPDKSQSQRSGANATGEGALLQGMRALRRSDEELQWEEEGSASATRTAISEMKSAPAARTVAIRAGLVAYGLKAGQVRAIELHSSARVLLRGHLGHVCALQFASLPDKQQRWLLASAEPGAQRVIIWDIFSSGSSSDSLSYSTVCMVEHEGGLGGSSCVLSFSPDASSLYVGAAGKLLDINLAAARQAYANCSGPSLPLLEEPACKQLYSNPSRSPITSLSVKSEADPGTDQPLHRSIAIATESAGEFVMDSSCSHPISRSAEPAHCIHTSWLDSSGNTRLVCSSCDALVRVPNATNDGESQIAQRVKLASADDAPTSVHTVTTHGLVFVSKSDQHVVNLLYYSPEGYLHCAQRFTVGGALHACDVDFSEQKQELHVACWQGTSIALVEIPVAQKWQLPAPTSWPEQHSANSLESVLAAATSARNDGSDFAAARTEHTKPATSGVERPHEASEARDAGSATEAFHKRYDQNAQASKDLKSEAAVPSPSMEPTQSCIATTSDGNGYAGDEEPEEGEVSADAYCSEGPQEDAAARTTALMSTKHLKDTQENDDGSIQRLEHRIGTMMQEQMDALREEREERNRIEQERHRKLLEAVAQSFSTSLQQHLNEAVSRHVADIARAVVSEQEYQLRELKESLASHIGYSTEHITKATASAADRTLNAMLQQYQQHAEQQQRRDESTQMFADAAKQAVQDHVVPSVSNAISESMKQIHSSLSHSVEAASSALERSAEGVQRASEECSRAAEQVRSVTAGNDGQQKQGQHNGERSVYDSIVKMVEQEQYEEAFQRALMTQDVGILEAICERVAPSTVFTPDGSKLPQHVIASLVHYLGTNLASKPEVRLAWVSEGCQYLDRQSCSAKLAETIEETLTALRGELMMLRQQLNPEGEAQTLKQCRIALQTVTHTLSAF